MAKILDALLDSQLNRFCVSRKRPAFDRAVTRDIERYFDQYATVQFANFPVGDLRDAPCA